MSYRIIAKNLGTITLVEAACMLLPLAVSFYYNESPAPFLYTMLILIAVGVPLYLIPAKNNHFYTRGAYVTAGIAWITLSIFGALPFQFSGRFASFIDCIFEAVSGFTTTGATILSEVESLPKSILFWRSFTHFIGGMGIIVLTTALLPSNKGRTHHLMQAEVPGPTADKLVPKLSQSSKILYSIYIALTGIMIVCLLCTGIGLFNSVTVAFATAGTGGFAVTNASIGAFNSPAVEIITSIFMLLFATNFTVHFLIFSGRIKQALDNFELKFFVGFVAICIAIITANIYHIYQDVFVSLRHALFYVSSIVSTTGFGTVDYNLWPTMCHVVIVILMIVGACAGSTGGGIKCSRLAIVLKSILREIKQLIHPKSVNVIRVDGKTLDEKVLTSILRFCCAYAFITFAATLLISFENADFTTVFTSVLSCMGNIGPGLNLVGPTGNFGFYSAFSKIVLSFCMLIGRLEIFPILILFTPSTWRKS